MDSSAAMTEFMRRVGRNGITASPSKSIAETTILLNDLNTKPVSRLFSLPGELRNQIWRDVLISPTGFIRPLYSGLRKNTEVKLDFHAVDRKAGSKPGPQRLYIHGEQIHLSLLTVNRQINRECAHIFWERNTFILQPDDILMSPAISRDNGLLNSLCRKIKYVQLDIDIRHQRLVLEASRVVGCNGTIPHAVAILDTMARDGELTTLSIKPVVSLQNLEEILDGVHNSWERMGILANVWQVFDEANENSNFAGVRKTVEVDIRWDELHALEQKKWNSQYRELGSLLLSVLAVRMGGVDGEFRVDGMLMEKDLANPKDIFPLKGLEEKEKVKHDSFVWDGQDWDEV